MLILVLPYFTVLNKVNGGSDPYCSKNRIDCCLLSSEHLKLFVIEIFRTFSRNPAGSQKGKAKYLKKNALQCA